MATPATRSTKPRRQPLPPQAADILVSVLCKATLFPWLTTTKHFFPCFWQHPQMGSGGRGKSPYLVRRLVLPRVQDVPQLPSPLVCAGGRSPSDGRPPGPTCAFTVMPGPGRERVTGLFRPASP